MNTIEKIRQENLKTDIPEMGIGDTVEVGFRIKEGGKERVQNFTGVIISRHGTGIAQTITLRRVRAGQGVERVVHGVPMYNFGGGGDKVKSKEVGA